MKFEKTPCPECNTPQRFVPRNRRVVGRIETYIQCRACGYERVLKDQTQAERLQERRDRVKLLRALRRTLR